jgi:hypothetical protein
VSGVDIAALEATIRKALVDLVGIGMEDNEQEIVDAGKAALAALEVLLTKVVDQQSNPALETLDWSIGDSPQLLQERADRAKEIRDAKDEP